MSRIAATHATEKLQLSNTPGLTLTPAHARNVITSIRESPLKFLHGCAQTVLILLRMIFADQESEKTMLHLIWYIFVGFLVGCVAKALMHTHLSIMWTVVLGIVGSIIGGAVTHLFYPPGAGGKFHLGGVIVSIVGAILVLYIWHKFRLQLPRG
jgi:uncharacterized membrane protein YeaQ/YmgE (transglycosylase-associated protein family)